MARYGQLMTTLFLGQDAATSSGAAVGNAQSPVLSLNLSGGPAVSNASSSDPSKSSSRSKDAKPAPTVSEGGEAEKPLWVSQGFAGPGGMIRAANLTSEPQAAVPAASSPNNAAAPASTPHPGKGSSVGSGGSPSPAAAQVPIPTNSTNKAAGQSSGSNIPGAWAVRMNEDYFNLDFNLGQMLFISCLNENDPTRLSTPVGGFPDVQSTADGNRWLRKLCDQFDDLQQMMTFGQKLVELEKELGYPPRPIDPWTPMPGEAEKTAKNANLVAQIQTGLVAAGCGPLTVDGKVGDQTIAAVVCFQKKRGLEPTGVLDRATLNVLSTVNPKTSPAGEGEGQ
jgi:hypothetical protein